MSSISSSFFTPLSSARQTWPRICSGRHNATSAATVIRLRSRLTRPGRSQTSPNTTFSVSSPSFGKTSLTWPMVDGGNLRAMSESPREFDAGDSIMRWMDDSAQPESAYAWMRLAASLVLMTLGGVAMYGVVVVLPLVQADFGVTRGE